jgi:hypothetical protein
MNQNIFCSKCHRIPSQCCCSSANELADELVWIAKNRGDSISRQLADIVCQQQAEIEALKLRELTDEEIISEWIGNDRNYYNFARAILKKASEK